MKLHTRVLIGTSACLLAGSVFLLAHPKSALDAGRAREMLRHLGGGDLPKNQVRIKQVSPGVTGNDAIVEAQIETTWRFTQSSEGWKIAEVRLGDRQWESVELITEAVRREKIRRTSALMQQLAEGLETHRQAQGSYIIADSIVKLLDQLPPRFASLRNDLWGTQFSYQGTAAGYRLISAGDDRKAGTPDDLVLENGKMQTPLQ